MLFFSGIFIFPDVFFLFSRFFRISFLVGLLFIRIVRVSGSTTLNLLLHLLILHTSEKHTPSSESHDMSPSIYRRHSTAQSALHKASTYYVPINSATTHSKQADKVAESQQVRITSSSIYRAVLSKEAKHTYCTYVYGGLGMCKSSVCT